MDEIIFYLMRYGTYAIDGIIAFIFLKFIFSKTLENYHSSWNILIDNFEYSPKEFYKRFKTELESHGITL
ncbi:MAG: hypothetical protein ABF263_09245 [Polaribacter sp.]